MGKDFGAYIEAQQGQMFDLLGKLVRINSGSNNKNGVDAVGREIAAALNDCALTQETIGLEQAGNLLIFRTPPALAHAGQALMVGHMDTVFAPGTDFNDYREDDSRSYGPGVIDMKGGLVAGIFALKALAAGGLLNNLPLAFVCTSDEEIGSPWSKSLIRQEARKSNCAFVLEVGGIDGQVVTGRKGNLSARLTIEGRAGHAAFAGTDKTSAIVEMAHKILAIEALNDPAKGLSANVGLVSGGIGPNTVAAHAEARLDFRFIHAEDGRQLKARLFNICSQATNPNATCKVEILSGRPPMPANEANERLYRHIAHIARHLKIPIGSEFRSGVSDANFIDQAGTPVIDGLGPIGAGDHSPREYMVKDSLPQRTLLLASVLADYVWGNKRY
ncbi:peptidase M20 [Desulfosarcina variabilis str. Montpellier]|uniref:M20 family metallopeptidase n=1 Tax=Desulfosarcina variabilis TaxID=2300 RepID=UPI003AFA13FD